MYAPVLTVDANRKFTCTADKCVDHCCQAGFWNITIDSSTYEMYKEKFNDGEIGDLLKDKIVKRDLLYYIDPLPDNRCPFLNESRLCAVQKKYGERYLSFTCHQFPKSTKVYGGFMQILPGLECPIAAEMILCDKDIIKIDTGDNVFISDEDYTALNGSSEKSRFDTETCLLIRDASIGIVSAGGVTFPVKAFYLCTMLDSLNNAENIPGKLRVFLDNARNETVILDILKLREEKSPHRQYELPLILKILKIMQKPGYRPAGINEDFYDRLQTCLSDVNDFDIPGILDFKRNKAEKFFDENERLTTNYLIHHMIINRFPYENPDPVTSGVKMCLDFILIEYFIACLYKDVKELELYQVINCVYYFSRLRGSYSADEIITEMTKINPVLDLSLLITL